MDIEKSCICVFKGPKQFLKQVVSTRSNHLSTLDVNQCQDSSQVLRKNKKTFFITVLRNTAAAKGEHIGFVSIVD